MEDQGQNDPLFPIAVLIDELKVQCSYTPTCLRTIQLTLKLSISMMMSSSV